MRKIKNFVKYSKSFFEENNIQTGIFFISTSVAIGAFLGGKEYGAQFAAAAGTASSLDVILKYFGVTDSYYITAAMLGVMGSYQDHSHTKIHVHDTLMSNMKDSSSVPDLVANIFTQVDLIKQIGTGAATGILGASAFSWGLNTVSNNSSDKFLPYSESRKTILSEEDTIYTHEGASAHDEI
ncbi:hypothetical protein I862_05700 [endosymbiont of Acanthamoeba sp. UWC8]|uniref:hypothetical protein n=1 Tax=endosymbiont of Acanthamoeba sp. UWC8 TaxID=86106 RepID=UPI0004D14DDF|nr:hypothetical protein [endosymbiont of Acanthamoeba sp. UWC8]AIF81694.1 hypothetical protein I862_05700 [endosymbiont of Acanthamoeba sp. UWC8]